MSKNLTSSFNIQHQPKPEQKQQKSRIFQDEHLYQHQCQYERELQKQNMAKKQLKLIRVCPQFLLITPCDTLDWGKNREILSGMLNGNNFNQKFLNFVQGNIRQRSNNKYPNIRLLRRIKTQYFWSCVTKFLAESTLKDSTLLSGIINPINFPSPSQSPTSPISNVLTVTKYQLFLLLAHMLMGTMPKQLQQYRYEYVNKEGKLMTEIDFGGHFGEFMSVRDWEDDITNKEEIQFRTNKIKTVVKYFCVFFRRSTQRPEMKNQMVIFHRYSMFTEPPQQPQLSQLLPDTLKLSKPTVTIGSAYQNECQLSKILLFPLYPSSPSPSASASKLAHPFSKPAPYTHSPSIPGLHVINPYRLALEQKIFFSRTQLMVLPFLVLTHGLGRFEVLAIHGVEKFGKNQTMKKYQYFSFNQVYKDSSQINQKYMGKNNTIVFYNAQPFHRKHSYSSISHIITTITCLKSTLQFRSPSDPVISSQFPLPPLSLLSLLSLLSPLSPRPKLKLAPLPQDLHFLLEWISTSTVGYNNFIYYVENEEDMRNFNILVKEMKQYTMRDVLAVIEEYWQWRAEGGIGGLLGFLRDFVL